jgi:DNA-binding NtrC family response regulator
VTDLELLAEILKRRRPGENARDCANRVMVTAALEFARGNQTHAAEVLGMARKNFNLHAADHRLRPCDRRTA